MTRIIGHKLYEHLKSLPELTEHQKELVKARDNHFKGTAEQQQAQKEYWKKVYEDKEFGYNTINDFKRELVKQHGEHQLLENMKPIANALAHYVVGDKAFIDLAEELNCQTAPSLDKGILLVGEYGIGKSFLLQKINQACQNLNFRNPIKGRYVSTISLVKDSHEDENMVYQSFVKGKLVLDDLGADHDTNFFGRNGSELIGSILEQRYMNGLKTFASTNYNHGKLGGIYGKRLHSRFYEMFNIFELNGEDLRR